MQMPVPQVPGNQILGLIKSFCRTYAQPVPASTDGSSDAGSLQLREMLQDIGEFCREFTDWQFCRREVTWAALPQVSQGPLHTIFPDAYAQIMTDTVWDIAERQLVLGPVSDAEWASFQASFVSPWKRCYVARNQLHIYPAPETGRDYFAIYRSRHWLVGNDGETKEFITADADTPLFPATLMKAGLAFYWKRAKELPYATEEARFLDMLSDLASQNIIRPVLQMDAQVRPPRPGIVVPLTNWGQ